MPPRSAAAVHHIVPGRAGFADVARDAWRHRELLYYLVWRNLKVRYKQTAIGVTWAVLQPTALAAVFSVFFGRLASFPTDGLPAPLFFVTTLLPWTYLSAALIAATGSLAEQQHLITRVYFPRIFLPMAAVVTPLIDLVVASAACLLVAVSAGMPLRAGILVLPLVAAYATIVAFAAGLWLSAANAYYRDVRHAVPFAVQLLLFASPVAYPASAVPAAWRLAYGANPAAGVIEVFRWAVTGVPAFPVDLVISGAVVTLVVLITGLAVFQRVEGTLADVA